MILSFDKPKKTLSTDEHNYKYSSDSGIAGTYVPNMSNADMKVFKAKHIGGIDERIEIRVLLNQVSIVIKVFSRKRKSKDYWKSHNHIQLSMNGKLDVTFEEWSKVLQAIDEAKQIMK
jgi:hypothetical protein